MIVDSLYAHFPFCEARCHYCDFYSIGKSKTKLTDPEQFRQSLHQEAFLLKEQIQLPLKIKTIFLGGGTPSMTPSSTIEYGLEPLLEKSELDSDYEWTLEANPSSINKDTLKSYMNLGINRISLGIQSLIPKHLSTLGRVHTQETAIEALDTIFQSGMKNVSVDILCGVPDQSISDLETTLSLLFKFPIQHLSCYLLTLAPHHPMYKKLPTEDIQVEHLIFIHEWMESKKFEHYEISNYSVNESTRAKHNLNTWKRKSYLGLGPSAHSFDSEKNTRWKNVSSLHQYSKLLQQQILPIDSTETLTAEQTQLEHWMLAIRLREGFPLEWLRTSKQKQRAKKLTERGLLEESLSNLRLTPIGFALSDQVIASLAI